MANQLPQDFKMEEVLGETPQGYLICSNCGASIAAYKCPLCGGDAIDPEAESDD